MSGRGEEQDSEESFHFSLTIGAEYITGCQQCLGKSLGVESAARRLPNHESAHIAAVVGGATVVPQQVIILLSGIPACGKGHFAGYLAIEHGFVHYDLECYPTGWPCQELHDIWDKSRVDFVAQLRKRHQRVVLDWGFPPECHSWVDELRSQGVRLIWFEGDVVTARQKFIERGRGRPEDFDRQVENVRRVGYPHSLGCEIIVTLPAVGACMPDAEIEQRLFG